jgi:photosystem II stability/assembly factor-like uncharacterized protein
MKKIIYVFLLLAFLPLYINAQWLQITSPTTNYLYGVYFNDANTGYLCGSTSGTVIKTTNGGNSWIFNNTGTSSTFYDIVFTSVQTGFVAGSLKQVIKTTNSGTNWDIKTSGTGTVNSMSFPAALIGYAVGGSPSTLDKSTDGGNNWVALIPPTSNTIRGVYFFDANTGWLCGYSGTLWKTTDGCTSWIPQTQLTTYSMEKLFFTTSQIGYVVANAGIILKTTNGGTNWLTLSSGVTSNLYDIFFSNPNTGWASGASGIIIKTSDAGNTWYQQSTPNTTSTFYAIHMADINNGYAVGSSGILVKTTNGGGVPTLPFFEKLTSISIVLVTNASDRCAFGDYDNDGLLDIVISTYNDACPSCTYPLLLFHAIATGSYERITTGPIATVTSRTYGVAWGDYDNDGKLDLFVCVGWNQNNLLFHNEGNGNFTQVTSGSIVNDGGWSECCAWCDYDRDGWLDLFVGNQSDQNNFLYHNNGNGTFTKVTTGSIVNDGGYSRGNAWGDYDNDGWPDLFVVNYQGENDFLYHNNGNGTFTRILTGPEVNDGMWGSGCAWGDYDNDGYLDLFVANCNQPNQLYHNDGNGTFSLFSGCSWGDYDNDGFLDLFFAKQGSPNGLYKNINGQSFVKITNELPAMEGGHSVANAWGDYNNDGKLDLFVTNNNLNSVNFFYKNIGNTGNYIMIKLKGCVYPIVRSNYNGIGARINIYSGNTRFIREVSGGMGMGSQDMFWQHVGLGNIQNIDSVVVYWPSGNIQKFTNVSVNRTLMVDECTVGININSIPVNYSLEQNIPNPFNPKTSITYSLKKLISVNLFVYDITGRFVQTLVNKTQTAGKYEVEFDGSNYSSGIYIYKLVTEEFTDTKKMVLLK